MRPKRLTDIHTAQPYCVDPLGVTRAYGPSNWVGGGSLASAANLKWQLAFIADNGSIQTFRRAVEVSIGMAFGEISGLAINAHRAVFRMTERLRLPVSLILGVVDVICETRREPATSYWYCRVSKIQQPEGPWSCGISRERRFSV